MATSDETETDAEDASGGRGWGPVPSMRFAFAVVLAILVGLTIAMALTYGTTSRFVPLIFAVPTFVALVLVALAEVSATVERFVSWFNTALFTTDSEMFDVGSTTHKPGGITRAVGWVLGLVVVAFLFGFVATIPVFVYAFLTVEGDHERRRSAIIAIATAAVISGLFEVLFGTALYAGFVPELVLDRVFGI